MATAFRQTSSRALVNQEAIQYIRPQTLTLTLIEARPRTQVSVFFGTTKVNHLCAPSGGSVGAAMITNQHGELTITLNIPANTFNVGTHTITVTDATTYAELQTTGTTFGSGKALFTADGRAEIYQTTVTTIIGIERPVETASDFSGTGDSASVDPLAQSFFTWGVPEGIFLTSIDVFFASKDPSLPVRIELRPMINGYPSSLQAVSKNFVSVKRAADVNVSTDASAATTFEFNPPVYLKGNSEFCFILRSNSPSYQVYTSRLGEVSIETQKRIYEQPYVGSIFKSENAVTWTAEQFEDIKFTLRKAVFSTSPGSASYTLQTPYLSAYGDQFQTTSGGRVITYTHPQDHGLVSGSSIYVLTDSGLSYNGINSADFSGTFSVTVVDAKTVTFTLPGTGNASSTGKLLNGGKITFVTVITPGSGYVIGDQVFNGVTQVGTVAAVDSAGGISSVTITNQGSGLTTSPNLSVTSTAGTGCVLHASITPRFTVSVNKPLTGFLPHLNVMNFGTTSTVNTLSAQSITSSGGLTSYIFNEATGLSNLGQTLVVKSPENTANTTLDIQLVTDNPNVSPVIDVRTAPSISALSSTINNLTTNETNATGGAAKARYLTQKVQLQMVSNGIRVFSTISSVPGSSVNWYVRTSLSTSGVNHDNLAWTQLTCAVERTKSAVIGEFYEYEFTADSLPAFDTYDLKCVMTATDRSKSPIISSYRVIVLT